MKKSEEPLHSLTLRLPLSLYKRLSNVITECGLSSTEYIRRALVAALDRDSPAAPVSWTDDELRAEIAAMQDRLEAMKLYLEATKKYDENNQRKNSRKTGVKA